MYPIKTFPDNRNNCIILKFFLLPKNYNIPYLYKMHVMYYKCRLVVFTLLKMLYSTSLFILFYKFFNYIYISTHLIFEIFQ